MAAFAEIEKGLTGKMPVLDGDGFDDDTSPAKKHIALATRIRPDLTLDHHAEFDEVGSADRAAIRVMNDLDKRVASGSPKKTAASAEVSKIIWAKSFGQSMFVIQKFGVIEVRTFYKSRGSLRNREKFLHGGFPTLVLQTLVSFPQCFDDDAGHGFACCLS